MKLETTTPGLYPAPFVWTNSCSGGSGSGTFTMPSGQVAQVRRLKEGIERFAITDIKRKEFRYHEKLNRGSKFTRKIPARTPKFQK